jgi:8-oxo-dGTP pyrophosphatase MutT (NUDIX family)
MMAFSANTLGKVTAFITRKGAAGDELLLLRHPHAGVQIPAGTIEPGETPEQAVLREVREETGITRLGTPELLGQRDEQPPGGSHVIMNQTLVYSRPNPTSFDWVSLPRGVPVSLLREEGVYAQVSFIEHDRFPDPTYISYAITGWVPQEALATAIRRFFYRLPRQESTPQRWEQFSDNHRFVLFWASLGSLPEIVSPQDTWLPYLINNL